MKRLSFVLVFSFLLASCGYDGYYRYPCQDPENWGKTECEPPACKVDGACTETLLGLDPTETSIETIPTEEAVAP
ncbi:hypothetical protein UFOVP1217_32 [uncultured Caudovirales phage]|uniref:Lipoprotein n=1 Tax=uncultured Caudovirales phage TaxID=2100421 RepID=A0A6J5SR35_9CAUD|nr:hypothetical protein UFOVP465_110 [uncultured Caudovirales phage]CAB4156782.1 hypothetical protein UFOVP666_156 [uncultured Caudovirales phage]CAB4160062.1 hypothetical protein UFOVP727_45 [uncultured Caudovirales phage]CAB4164915.1 hypothetical protein UFOVP819_184 [uncultured Caudovirales phage]CAB4172247.1 hypothetical protein UFOVP926_90 [uncultured Caudovirales phage]